MARTTDTSLRAKLALATTTTALAVGLAFALWTLRGPRSSATLTTADTTDVVWNGDELYAVDEVAGHRPRRSSTWSMPMLAVDDSDLQKIEKHRDGNAFLRATELPKDSPLPKVLVLGDSHVDGVVSTADNFTSLLESASSTTSQPYLVLNAGCGLYSLWQHVLRARALLAPFRPRVVVITVFLGNDFLDLEDAIRPHLDDALRELPAEPRGPTETTSARMAELAIPDPNGQLFWQGLNQALYLEQHPERLPVLVRKCEHAVDTMERAAREHGAQVVWALLPSFDLVLPDHTMSLGPVAKRLCEKGTQRAMRDAFVAVLNGRGLRIVDFEPAFRVDRSPALYAKDFHVYRKGHRLMADALRPVLAELLR